MNKRLHYIDGLKGILAISIVFFHYFVNFCNSDSSSIPLPITGLFTKSWLAVEFFFILSGYLTANACTEKEQMSFSHYIYKKLLRIMPCFLLSNLLIVLISLFDQCFIKSNMTPPVNLWMFFMSCMPFNYGWVDTRYLYSSAGWFIPVLFLCYVIYFAILKIKSKYCESYVLSVVVMVLVGWSANRVNIQIPFLYENTSRGYICFFVGVLLSYLFKKQFNKRVLSIWGLISLGNLFLLAHKYGFEVVFGNLTYCFSFIIWPMVLLIIMTLPFLQKLLSVRPLLYVGKISMSIYLMHEPLFRIMKLLDYDSGGGYGTVKCSDLRYYPADRVVGLCV